MFFAKERFAGRIKNNLRGLANVLLYYTFAALLLKSILALSIVMGDNNSKINFSKTFYFDPSMAVYSCFILIVLSFSFLFSGRKRFWFLVLLNLSFSTLMVLDLWYYRGYGNFLSILLLGELANLQNLSSSIISMARPVDLVFVVDAFLLFPLLLWKRNYQRNAQRCIPLFVLAFAIPLAFLVYEHYEIDINNDESELFMVCWVPQQTISNLSPLGYHIYDFYVSWNDRRQRTLSQDEKDSIERWFDKNREVLPPNKYHSIMRGKNLLYIQVESLESFVINQKVNGIEITPTINKLLTKSIYFTDFYEQVHNGTSSDAELMVNTSVFPVRRGSTFFRYPNNTYESLPKLLKQKGYSTLAMHPDKGTYWNWVKAHSSIGFDKCIDLSFFVPDELIGLGLSDGSYFKQAEPFIKKLPHPFYVFMITDTSHGPFDIPAKYRELHLNKNLDESKLGGYFESIHYTDKQIGLFLSRLKDDGLLENTVVVVAGDHCGIHKFYNDELEDIQPREDWWYTPKNHIPFIIWQQDVKGEVVPVTGGQIDIMPTLACLFGIDENLYSSSAMGRNLLNTNKSFAVLDDGSYVGKYSNEEEKKHALDGIGIADLIITSNYFEQNKSAASTGH
jgi:lipoteichoic acid synthase